MKTLPVCDKCKQTVSLNEGMLSVFYKEVQGHEEKVKLYEQKHTEKSGIQITSLKSLLEYPDAVKWHWGHPKCMPDSMYEIEISRFDNVDKALDWTLHLMEKDWFASTNWRETVERFYDLPNA